MTSVDFLLIYLIYVDISLLDVIQLSFLSSQLYIECIVDNSVKSEHVIWSERKTSCLIYAIMHSVSVTFAASDKV